MSLAQAKTVPTNIEEKQSQDIATANVTQIPKVPSQYADESYKLFAQIGQIDDPTPEEALRIRNKCIKWILPFLCVGYHVMYVDKQTLGSSSILGILTDTHLNTSEYNWLSSIFYLGYLLAEWPQNWALQRFPVAKWLVLNLVIWAALIFLHAACSNFAGLFVVRFLLGVAEACMVPSFLLILSMFFTYNEQAVLMPCMWAIGNAAPVTSGLLSYGVLHIDTGLSTWKWFMIINGAVTMVLATAIFFFFPDSPITAHFLTPLERGQAILRIKSNHSGIEQKRFKKHQFIEALKDPKTWLFFFHAWSQELANGLTNQYSLIIKSFGFSVLETTLLGCVTGVANFISLATAAVLLAYTTNSRGWISAIAYAGPALSCILALALPSSARWGLVAAIWIRAPIGVPYAVVMIWAANCTAGHTKKTTVIALYHVGYGLGNILSPQLFQDQYKPRYYVPWAVILGIATVLPTLIILYTRYYLQKENKRRDALVAEGKVQSMGVVESGEGGNVEVDNNQLDLTDRENMTFRYVL